jgi:hypothetical protein
MCFLNEIIFQYHYQPFIFIIKFLIIINNILIFIYFQKTSNNINNKLKKKKKSFIDSSSNEDDEEKIKKILKIILYITLLILGGGVFYYIYIFNIPENFTIEKALEQLKILLPEERYKQISVVVFEMIERPDKLGKGLHLLYIIKTLLKEDFPKNFEKIMNDIIKYFEEKK